VLAYCAWHTCSIELSRRRISYLTFDVGLCICRRVSYAQEGQLFHVLVAEGITFLCMADEVRLEANASAAARILGIDIYMPALLRCLASRCQVFHCGADSKTCA
jgi:hypothetical protein